MSTFRGAIKRLNCDSKISAIFFDLDNTLIATRKADAKACSKVLGIRSAADCGIPVEQSSSGVVTVICCGVIFLREREKIYFNVFPTLARSKRRQHRALGGNVLHVTGTAGKLENSFPSVVVGISRENVLVRTVHDCTGI
uniref:Uncharacterized protein n=1 Tax=Anopheles culicifacies TaxID=139723 RepID=A0A182MS38_9DIPT